MCRFWLSLVVLSGFFSSFVLAGQKSGSIYDRMDYGPYLAASIISDTAAQFDNSTGNFTLGSNKAYTDVTARGIAINLTGDWHAGMVFDTDGLRMSAGWIGGPLQFRGLIGNGDHGPSPTLSVPPTFQVLYGPGWADKNGSFKDVRDDYIQPLPPPGQLPADWGRYKGLYLNGSKVILSYTVGTSAVLESPGVENSLAIQDPLKSHMDVAFTRTFTLGASDVAQALCVADVNDRSETHSKDEKGKDQIAYTITPSKGEVTNGTAHVGAVHAAGVSLPEGAALEVDGNKIVLKLPARKEAVTFKVLIGGGGDAAKAAFEGLVKASPKPTDLTALTKGGPARWKEVVQTKGVLGQDKVVDEAKAKLKGEQDKIRARFTEFENRIKRSVEAPALREEGDRAKQRVIEIEDKLKAGDLKPEDEKQLNADLPKVKKQATDIEGRLKDFKIENVEKLKEELAKAHEKGKAKLEESIKPEEEVRIRQKLLDESSYVTDRLTIPYKNPYDSWMRTCAFDFFADGNRAAVSTWSGDVWIVSGIDDKLENLTWKRIGSGLHQPLGLKIVNDEIYLLCRDQITKLVDLNGDGEADFYQCFNKDWDITTAFHAFAFDLHTDPDGNFFFAFGSPVKSGGPGFHRITKTNGTIMKVSKDGSKMEIYATGLRAPNGMGVSPTGQVTIGDNEGSWVPTSPLHWVKQGSFLGMAEAAHGAKVEQPKPLLWLPHNADESHITIDNSCGGQVWVTSDKWGPYKGSLLHMSYGTSSLFAVMPQEVSGQMQGAAVRIPVNFTSSAMRARFNPADGQLYVVGLKGWQTNASNDGGFDRVRFTGKPVHLPEGFKATKKGIFVTYATKLDEAYANDASNFSVDAWNYAWTQTYGSSEYKLEGGTKTRGHDSFEVKSSKLQPDGKTVFLELPDVKPAMQIMIKSNIKAADGIDMKQDIFGTIYNLPEE